MRSGGLREMDVGVGTTRGAGVMVPGVRVPERARALGGVARGMEGREAAVDCAARASATGSDSPSKNLAMAIFGGERSISEVMHGVGG